MNLITAGSLLCSFPAAGELVIGSGENGAGGTRVEEKMLVSIHVSSVAAVAGKVVSGTASSSLS